MNFNKLFTLLESSIDYPQKGLCPDVWKKVNGEWMLKDNVKKKIKDLLATFEYPFKLSKIIKNIRIVGSMASNRYDFDTDIDVHLTVDISKLPAYKSQTEWQKFVMSWFKNNPDGFIGNHPIEVYIQYNLFQDLASEGVYSVTDDEWVKEPSLAKQDYDPYEFFKGVMEEVKRVSTKLDLTIGEVKREAIDYEVISNYIKKLPLHNQKELKHRLDYKRKAIEKTIGKIAELKSEIRMHRQIASTPNSEEEAEQLKNDEQWINANAVFKFLSRYGYLQIIGELSKMINDKKLEDDEIKKIVPTINNVKDVKEPNNGKV